ncbi:MAG: endonuclease domain-containing protein [Spirochaetota bacterium]
MHGRPRELRRAATEAEAVLWNFLRDRKLNGLKFRRQHRIDRMILDFYCAEKKLCVEVDGSIHETPDQQLIDAERTTSLMNRGIRVLRFKNDAVVNDIGSVLASIRAACG